MRKGTVPFCNMQNEYYQLIEEFVRQAGEIALKYLQNSDPTLKEDGTVLTKADTAISHLSHEVLRGVLSSKEHILIEEEDKDVRRYLDQELLEKTPYVWSIDPIDGTRLYANRVPLFSISIGLLKDLKPWMGAVYFPAIKELFICDGQEAYFVQQTFTQDEQKDKIKPVDLDINAQSVFLCDDLIYQKFDWDYKDCQIMVSACATIDLCWPTIGRGCGGVFYCYIYVLCISTNQSEFI